METRGPQPPAGWYQDPQGAGHRYWDGTQWTEHRAPGFPQQPAVPPQTKEDSLTKVERIWACGAFGATLIGSLGPWATLGVFSKAGTDGDGVITLIAGIIGIILALVLTRGARVAVGVLGLIILAIGIIDIADVSSSGEELFGEEISPSVGWGLWVVTPGGAAATLCSVARRLGIGAS